MKNALIALLKVKSIVTITLTLGMLFLLSGRWTPSQDVIALYSTVYVATITYFFTRKDDAKNE